MGAEQHAVKLEAVSGAGAGTGHGCVHPYPPAFVPTVPAATGELLCGIQPVATCGETLPGCLPDHERIRRWCAAGNVRPGAYRCLPRFKGRQSWTWNAGSGRWRPYAYCQRHAYKYGGADLTARVLTVRLRVMPLNQGYTGGRSDPRAKMLFTGIRNFGTSWRQRRGILLPPGGGDRWCSAH